jgi:hypothetical protein
MMFLAAIFLVCYIIAPHDHLAAGLHSCIARGSEFAREFLLYPILGTGKKKPAEKKLGDFCSNFFQIVVQSKADFGQGYSIKEAQ